MMSATKNKTAQNGSILSFFKKQDGSSYAGTTYNGLFLEGGPDEAGPLRDDIDVPGLQDDIHDSGYESPRFNESGGSNKRRKLSQELDGQFLTHSTTVNTTDLPKDACSPPPPDIDVEGGKDDDMNTVRSKHIGPFLDESDDEDGGPESLVVEHTADPPRPNGDTLGGDIIPEDLPVPKREATSYGDDGFEDFEGMDDIDDEYEGGEEFIERRYMMEQRRLEIEAGVLQADADDLEDFPEFKQNGDPIKSEDSVLEVPTCPICNASFKGVSDQDASVHVNHCLDGNPTPLPNAGAPTEQDIKETPTITNSASNFKRQPKPGQQNPFTLGAAKGTSSAFTKLMSGHAEDEAWANAAAAENAARGKPAYQRTCPFYKILPGFNICVDAFRYGAVEGCKAYFLSHFHSDHYVGLTANWSHGPIYCSHVTANLVRQQLRVDPQYVVDLAFEETVTIPNTNGVRVTMLPANHCPGSSIYLYEKTIGRGKNPKVQRVLHTGDFRACPAHVEHPLLRPDVLDSISGKTRQQRIDVCYLDTTYLNPKYAFPSQEDVIASCSQLCVALDKQTDPKPTTETLTPFIRKEVPTPAPASEPASDLTPTGKLLIIVGTYSIGKERIALGIARALNTKIYAPPSKMRIVAALEDPELNARMTRDPRAAQVHMTPLFEIRAETLAEYLSDYKDRFSRIIGFRPTGWNYRPPGSRAAQPAVAAVLSSAHWRSAYSVRDLTPQRGSTPRAAVYGVPYSEHSSFRELTMFCCALRIDRVIPTVNIGSAASRERMRGWVERWAVERRKSGLFDVSGWGAGAEALNTTL